MYEDQFAKEGAKIGAELRIHYPNIQDVGERMRAVSDRQSFSILHQSNALLNTLYVNGWKPKKLTRWQHFRRDALEWRDRFKNAWLALKGYQIEDRW